jgi:broad specificity polyphosphatase/5'/3'-nucleotidase SurE
LYELLLIAAASDKVYQLPAHGRWFSPGTPASSTTKTGRHDLAEILLKLVLSTINKSINQSSVIDAYFYLQVCLH